MHIIAYVHAYVPHHGAGAETTLHDQLRALVLKGHKCTVLLSRSFEGDSITQDYTYEGVDVIAFDGTSNQLFHVLEKADVVLTHLDATERATAAQHIHGKPIVQIIHNTMMPTVGYLAMGAQLAVFNTDWVREYHEKAVKTAVVPIVTMGQINWQQRMQGAWPSVVVHPPVHSSNYQTLGLGDCITLINLWPGGTYGGTATGKGPEIFYEMARRFPHRQFLGVKGGYGEQQIEDLPNVEFMENTSDPREIYERTSILLVPSRYESFGRVAIEAGASGIPVIATPTPGLKEALGEGALFAEYEDMDAWESHLRLLEDPFAYAHFSDYSWRRSRYWDQQIPRELESFCTAIEEVARKGL